MKNYNWKKFIKIIVISAFLGGIVGFAMAYFQENSMIPNLDRVINSMPLLFVLSTVAGVVSLCMYFHYITKLKRDDFSIEENSYYEKHEIGITIALKLATICAILNFTAFGINIKNLTDLSYLFIVNVVLSLIGEVSYISLIKKLRPELNADPLDNKFSQKYYDKLDECEKHKVGKASLNTINSMTIVYIILFLISYLSCDFFNISPVVCLPIGLIWLIQTLLFTYFSVKVDKK